MPKRHTIIYILALTVFGLAAVHREPRKLHRLVGGHVKIINTEPNEDELLLAQPSGGGRNKKQSKHVEEEKKTLSQQVADGKYGLIQKEIFSKPSKRPGLISYENNSDVPKDNINNLGGLSKDDIWLAENHLLVVKGGTYPPHDDKLDNAAHVWPPIDDYKAPRRQVKLPAHPKVPPPFPVQLTDDGPLQILGTNTSRTLNGSIEAGVYALPPPEGYVPGAGPFFAPPPPFDPNQANATAGQAPKPNSEGTQGEYPEGGPFPPFFPTLNGSLPPYFASLPPGAAILPPPDNLTDQYDEDDPSIYYPPPYSFYYPKDNSSKIPAGPLVPGIILPPPPNFFGPLEEEITTKKQSYRTRKPTTSQVSKQIVPTTTPLSPTSVINGKYKKRPNVPPVQIPEINNELKPIITTTKTPKLVTVLPVRLSNRTRTKPTTFPDVTTRLKPVTVLRPVKPATSTTTTTTTLPTKIYVYKTDVGGKPFAVYGPPQNAQQKTMISSTQVPLRVYYSTSNEIETNSVTQPPEKFHIAVANERIPQQKPTRKPPAQYFFYEEEPRSNVITTLKPVQNLGNGYLDVPNQYFVPPKPRQPDKVRQPPPSQQQYIYVTGRPYNTQKPKYRFVPQTPQSDTFSIHIARLQKQIHQYYTTPRSVYRPINTPKPVYQYSFQAANYRPRQKQVPQNDEDKFRPLPKYSVQIQPAIEIIPNNDQNAQPPVYYQENYVTTTERPAPSRYYSTSAPEYQQYQEEVAPNRGQIIQNVVTPRPISQFSFEATPSPVYQGYYTQPDEGYFDEATKKYFTTFGKKIPVSTSPLPEIPQTTPVPLQNYNQNQQIRVVPQQPNPASLAGDTLVNYLNPKPTVNPDAELIAPNNPQLANYQSRPAPYVQQPQRENGPQVVKSIPVNLNVPPNEGQGSFISYQLPGDDGAHFYFLTPQLAQRRDQGAGYFYSRRRRNHQVRDAKR